LFIDGKVLVLRVVDLDIGLVAHINSVSYGEKQKHTGKEITIKAWH
jgi:hypothetical protein